MILIPKEEELYSPATFSQDAEESMMLLLLQEKFLSNTRLQRRLASYIRADETEKSRLIMEIMELLWTNRSFYHLFGVFRDFDTVLSVMGRKGHFIHQFEVFVLGWALIRSIQRYDSDSGSLLMSEDLEGVFTTWLMTSMAHDFGYPLQMATRVVRKFSDLYGKLRIDHLSKEYRSLGRRHRLKDESRLMMVEVKGSGRTKQSFDVQAFLQEAIAETLDLTLREVKTLLKKLGDRNHGYVSAIILCSFYDKDLLRNSAHLDPSSPMNRKLRLASAAIALHALPGNLQEYTKRMSFDRNPYCYLLFLVDNLQEWSRNFRPEEGWPSYSLLGIRFKTPDNELQVSYMLKHMKWTEPMKQQLTASLKEKRERIESLTPRSSPAGLRISVEFRTNNHAEPMETIQVSL